MTEMLEELQRRMCKAYGVEYTPPAYLSKVGIPPEICHFSPDAFLEMPIGEESDPRNLSPAPWQV